MSEADASDSYHNELVTQFIQLTGADEQIARGTLEAAAWDIDFAVNMHMDSQMNEEAPVVLPPPPPLPPQLPTASDSPPPVPPRATPASTTTSNNMPTSSSSSSSHFLDSDEVRPPIPPMRDVLVDPFSNYAPAPVQRMPQGIFDQMRNFQDEARWREAQREDDPELARNAEKRRTLEDLFRPPLDLMFSGSMDMAKEEGVRGNKWLMVNIQDSCEFACQVLNRDVWSHQAVKNIINEHFVFWQVYKDSNEGMRYLQFYPFNRYPYVAILDPRTGELLKSWATIVDSVSFCDHVMGFLADHPSPDGSISASAPVVPTPVSSEATSASSGSFRRNIYEESEEEQIKRAIEASLKDVPSSSNSAAMELDENSDLETFPDSDEDLDLLRAVTKDEEMERPTVNSSSNSKGDDEDWKKYLGTGANSEIKIRYPDGQQENMTFPSDSKLKALFLYLSNKGYTLKEYEIVTNYPRRNVHEFSEDDTLAGAGFTQREMLFVQHKI